MRNMQSAPAAAMRCDARSNLKRSGRQRARQTGRHRHKHGHRARYRPWAIMIDRGGLRLRLLAHANGTRRPSANGSAREARRVL